MGLFDEVAGAVGSKLGGEGSMLQAGMGLIEQFGGIQGLIAKLKEGGLASEVQSWLSDGANQAVSGDKLQEVLGSDKIQALAGKFGLDPSTLSSGLANILPQLINKVSPGGSVSEDHAGLLKEGLSGLTGLLGGSK